jgi:hypothetical protein
MMLKTPKKKGGKRKKDHGREDDDEDDEGVQKVAATEPELDPDPEDPLLSAPIPRYNAMLAVLRNTLYMHVVVNSHSDQSGANFVASYGGIFERGSREFTLDDFYILALDKMDRYVCLKKSDVIIPPEGDDVSSSSDDDEEDGEDSDEDEEGDEKVSLCEEEAPEMKGVEEEVVTEPVSASTGRDTSFNPSDTQGFPTRPSNGFHGRL